MFPCLAALLDHFSYALNGFDFLHDSAISSGHIILRPELEFTDNLYGGLKACTFRARALEVVILGSSEMATFAADESAVKVTYHRPEIGVQNAVWASHYACGGMVFILFHLRSRDPHAGCDLRFAGKVLSAGPSVAYGSFW